MFDLVMSPTLVVGLYVGITILIVLTYYTVLRPRPIVCPVSVHQTGDGEAVRVEPQGFVFPTMNAFEQWWQSQFPEAGCTIPVLDGQGRERRRGLKARDTIENENENGWGAEQTYAKTPINKVDDYEFSRIFGYEKNGRMEVPPQNFNMILTERSFDWSERPVSTDERRQTYKGLEEGFTADGNLVSMTPTEAAQRYGEKQGRGKGQGQGQEYESQDPLCKSSKSREVAQMVANAYKSDPDYEPVITQISENHWEVSELKPRLKFTSHPPTDSDDTVAGVAPNGVDIHVQYGRDGDRVGGGDRVGPPLGAFLFEDDGWNNNWESGKKQRRMPEGMERMFGPTFDHKDWLVRPVLPEFSPDRA